MRARLTHLVYACGIVLSASALAGAQTPQVRIIPTDGQPADSVRLGQTFEIRAAMPSTNAPRTVTVRLTTPSGSDKEVTLHRIGTANGMATYGTGTVESIGGTRNVRMVASTVHRTTGTINDLELSNGEMVTAELVTPGGATGATASIPVYDNDVEQSIARNHEMLDAIGESLVRQRNEANAVMNDVNAPQDVRAEAQQIREEADRQLRQLGRDREAIARLQTPLAKLRMGNKAIDGLTRTDEALDLTAPITDRDVVTDNMISLATATTLATYKIVTDLSMAGAMYKAGQGVVSFAMDEYWMNKFFGPKLQALRDRMAGPAIDEFGRAITGADQRRAAAEVALGFLLMAKFPKFMDWLADGRPADIRVPGPRTGTPAPAPRAGTTGSQAQGASGRTTPDGPARPAPAGDKTQVFPETGTARQPSPGRRYTPEEQAAHEADEIAENLARYEGNLKAAREAGVSEARLKEITSRGKHGDPDIADDLGIEALKAQGKQLDMPLTEYTTAKMFETRNRLGTLTEEDYAWLRNRLAEDPNYLDRLPNRGRMLDDFDPAITPAQRDDLLQNARVRTMVDEAKSADATGTQRLPAGDADATPTVRLPAPAPAQPPAAGRPQTGSADPNATQRMAPPTAATNPDGTPTVKIPPPVADPGATTIITPTTGGATQRMGPPTAATNPDGTPTVKIPPPVADPGATTIITPTTGGATQRMGPPTAATNPDGTPTVKIPPPVADPGATTIITPTTGGATQRMGPPTAATNPDGTPTVKIPPPVADPGATTIITRPPTGGAGSTASGPPATGGGAPGGAAEPTTIGVVPGGGFSPATTVPPITFTIVPGAGGEEDDNFISTGGTFIDLVNMTDGIGVISSWGGNRNPTVQVMIIDSTQVRAAPGARMPFPAEDAAADLPARGPSANGGDQRRRQNAPVKVFLSSLGVSTGEAFEIRVVNDGDTPVELGGDGLVVEPLDARGQTAAGNEMRKSASNAASAMLNAYCLEFLRQPPAMGTLFRIASPELQQKFAPMRKVLQAARELQEAGLLTPDSNPAEYFHSIKQWALWSREQGFNLQSFAKAFMEHTKKNFAAAGRQWTRQIEDAIMGIVPGRWQDIAKVLDAAVQQP